MGNYFYTVEEWPYPREKRVIKKLVDSGFKNIYVLWQERITIGLDPPRMITFNHPGLPKKEFQLRKNGYGDYVLLIDSERLD